MIEQKQSLGAPYIANSNNFNKDLVDGKNKTAPRDNDLDQIVEEFPARDTDEDQVKPSLNDQ